MGSRTAVTVIPFLGGSPSWEEATAAFMRRDLAPGTRRVYRLTLEVVGGT